MPFERINKDTLPEFCPMKTSEETIKKVIERYGKDDTKRVYVPATITEKEACECDGRARECSWTGDVN
jgi:hypothetical protein